MFRPTGFAELTGKRVGIFGYGIEGRASAARIGGLAELVIVDDADLGPGVLVNDAGGHEALLTCDVVLKSPGIARRRPDVIDLETHGVTVTSALNLWLHESDRSRVLAVTGTKGKSTTTSLITFFLECLNESALALGNIGQPPYDPAIETAHRWLVLEVSSYQCVDIDIAPALVVVTSLGADHLDWHGSLEQYHADKLALTRAQGPHRTLVPDTAVMHEVVDQLGGEVRFVSTDTHDLAASLGLLGAHSASNVALALASVATLTGRTHRELRSIISHRAADFIPLRGRLTLIAERRGDQGRVRFVDDGLATAPLPTVAALDVFRDEPVALIAGGFDRGVDYGPLARALASRHSSTLVVTMGEAGRRIAEAARQIAPSINERAVNSMSEAVDLAWSFVDGTGVVLLSPAAPSFDAYRNWEERSDDFAREVRRVLSGEAPGHAGRSVP
ncbi:MAG TPA: UDP-N-acetylmuramoyl-L-alanine--D-glutamate ligase [Acidimicrobiales bacterium]|nr:UDP-N-acetylmuramoyl-L-alanine--D-glutamate ligase [Acidimicrobiales bacterium]